MHWIFPIFYNAIKKYIKCQELFLDTRDIAGAWGLDVGRAWPPYGRRMGRRI